MSGRGLTDAEMANYVRDHRCYSARRDVTIADWDRGVTAIEAAAAREALPSVEEIAAALSVAGDREGIDRKRYAEHILGALRAARASDGGR